MYLHNESDDVDPNGVAQLMSHFLIILSNYVAQDVYNMDDTGLYFKANRNKTLAQGKVKG